MKLFRIMFIMLFLVMSMSIVSAQDNLNDTMQADILASDEVGSFEELEYDICNANGTLEIAKDYRNDNYPEGITIGRDNLVINGNNHTIDGNGHKIFEISASSNITINNLIFINACSDGLGGAIGNGGIATLNNVSFVNNSAFWGGAIGNSRTVALNNVSFVNNSAEYGGAIYDSGVMELSGAVFINNSADKGGAIRNYGAIALNNVSFVNNSAFWGGAIGNNGAVALNNVSFVDNSANRGGAIYDSGVMELSGAVFIDNNADYGGAICTIGELTISNSSFTSKISDKLGQIYCEESSMSISNSTFLNITSSYSPALYILSSDVSISNSRFINLTADITAGAISIREGGNHYIEGCEFINTSSSKNAGALNIDISGSNNAIGDVFIVDTLFEDTYSGFGGALIQLGGNLCVNNSDFINNGATYNGGSVYLSYVDDAEIDNCTFYSNGIKALDNSTACGSAIYCDMSNLTLTNSRIINKSKDSGSAVYACDSSYTIANSIFMDNTHAIYTDFDKASNLANNVYGNGSVSTNNTFVLETIMTGEGMQLKLLNNSINVTDIPSRFDLRDWNWTSPVGNQGLMGACTLFAATEALESALRKACGITTPFSINNMQNTLMQYSNYGVPSFIEACTMDAVASYLVSWLGVFPQDYDTYDEVGKLSPAITTDENIHIQDVTFVFNREPGSVEMKSAILKYGGLGAAIYLNSADKRYINPETNALYVNDNITYCHSVEIVGWDDNYPKENFLIAPPGDGAWIVQNSWGTDWGDKGYLYLSYYDKSLLKCYYDYDGKVISADFSALGVIVENTVPYNKNYQYDIGWGDFDYYEATYANVFEALDDDLIAAVGTYFFRSDVDYRVDVYVNGELKLSQEGLSPFVGFHTIKLDEYVPIKAGDVFSAAITSNVMPIISFDHSRIHYSPGLSYKLVNGSWVDLYDEGKVACVKVYTVADDRHNATFIAPDRVIGVSDAISGYKYQFILKDENGTALANKEVWVSFNGENQTVTTDENGQATATLKANAEGSYNVEMTFMGDSDYRETSQNATITLKKQKTSIYAQSKEVDSQEMSNGYTYTAILKDNSGKPIANRELLFIFDGKEQNAKTDNNGMATVTLKTSKTGPQTITIKFKGDNTYQETSTTKTITVKSNGIVNDNTTKHENKTKDNATPDKKAIKTTDKKMLKATGNPILALLLTLMTIGITTIKRF